MSERAGSVVAGTPPTLPRGTVTSMDNRTEAGRRTVVAIETLDEERLRELSARSDQLGVLSGYVDADPRQDPGLKAASIDLRNRFRELQRRMAEDSDTGGSRDLLAALERLWPQLEQLTDPAAPGRGRIVFAALGTDWSVQLETALPVATRVVLDDGPFLHPLLELLDEGRAAGIVLVSPDGARMLEWRLGSLHELRRLEPEQVPAPHERAGQIGGGPQGQYNTPMREQAQGREREQMERFLDQVATVGAQLADERGWERILLSGGERWTEEAIARFPAEMREMVSGDSRVLGGLDDAGLATEVTTWAHEQHQERERALLAQVRESAGSGTAALGLSEVVAALNDGRVAHLVYDPQVRYFGSMSADGGLLYADDELAPDGQPQTPEPRLTERIVSRALHTSARISPVEGAAEAELAAAAGIAALLRW